MRVASGRQRAIRYRTVMRVRQSPPLLTICLGWLAATALGCTHGAAQPSPGGGARPDGEPKLGVAATVSSTRAAAPAGVSSNRVPAPPPPRPLRLATWNLQWLLQADNHG